MTRRLILSCLACAACAGAGCWFPDIDARIQDSDSLEDFGAVMSIRGIAGSSVAEVVAVFSDARGFATDLEDGRVVAIGGVALDPVGGLGVYSATIPANATYVVTVTDPTRGVQTTQIDAVDDVTITQPAAGETVSLSGFSLQWLGRDSSLDVVLTLSETIFGDEKRREFGPEPDAGGYTFDADDLSIFQQGANLLISVTRIRTQEHINGFGSATLTAEHTQSQTNLPGP